MTCVSLDRMMYFDYHRAPALVGVMEDGDPRCLPQGLQSLVLAYAQQGATIHQLRSPVITTSYRPMHSYTHTSRVRHVSRLSSYLIR